MGKVLSTYVIRPFRNYNVESRAHKYIEKEIPKAAPKHPSTVHLIQKLVNENPHFLTAIKEKDDKLVGHLKDVYVTATTIDSIKVPKTSKRTLPSRQQEAIASKVYDEDTETKSVVEGRITLMETTELLTKYHMLDADGVNLKEAAKKYRLDEDAIQQILKYFSTLQLHDPYVDKPNRFDGDRIFPLFVKPEKQKAVE